MDEENKKKVQEGFEILLNEELNEIKIQKEKGSKDLTKYTLPFLNHLNSMKMKGEYFPIEMYKKFDQKYMEVMRV